jgi:hypothetical protein
LPRRSWSGPTDFASITSATHIATKLRPVAGAGFSTSEPPVHQRFAALLSDPVPSRAGLTLRLPVRLQRADQTAHFRLLVGAASFTDSIGRQFRVEPTSFSASPLADASTRRAVQRHHRDRQAAWMADYRGASFIQLRRAEPSPRRSPCQRAELSQAAHWAWPTALWLEIGLPPRLLVNRELHSAEACCASGQTFQPFVFALGQQSPGLRCHDR